MLALAFSLFVFMYWSLLGRAVIALAYPRVGVLRSWLLSPGIGLSVVLLGLMIGNQAGIPIGRFAWAMSAFFAAATVAILVWKRPAFAWRAGWPFAAAVLFGLFWAGWPAFESGFRWISYANDDMANYCLAAQRFYDFGFYHVPTHADLIGADHTGFYFFMHVSDMMRFGAEHLVAWGAGVTRLKATQVFMPIILALALVQICAAGALVLHRGKDRRRARLTAWLLAISPLFMLGTLYQLIAQVGGVALMSVTAALLLRETWARRRADLIRYAVLPALTSAALCIYYPEVTPFIVLTVGAFLALQIVRTRRWPNAALTVAVYVLAGIALILRHNLISYVSILTVQAGGALHAANRLLSLFPYFMLPTGFSNLFGWMPISHDFPEPVLSLSVCIGITLALVLLVRSLWDAWKLVPAAMLLLVEITVAVRLFIAANDFGLYKIAMWLQPTLIAALAGLLLAVTRKRGWLLYGVVGLWILTVLPAGWYYANASRGKKAGGLTELVLASELGLTPKPMPPPGVQITSTVENVVAAKFAASELRGRTTLFVSRDYFEPTTRWDYDNPRGVLKLEPHLDEMAQAVPLIAWRERERIARGVLWRTQFSQPVFDRPSEYLLSVTPRLSLFNKLDADLTSQPSTLFEIERMDNVRNRLLFVHSGLGHHYYLGDRRKISFFQQEDDPFLPGRSFNGIGRFMFLRIEHPSPRVYIRIAATRSLVTGRTAWKPAAKVRGESDVLIDGGANGAFNLFVGPVTPVAFEGAYYLAIDFAEMAEHLPDYRPGLKALYGRDVHLDYRQIIGWARDISAIDEATYATLQRPRAIARFPEDLVLARGLEFAGIYEDGWVSPRARFVLAGAKGGNVLRLRGAVPSIPGSELGRGVVHVTINGVSLPDLPLPPGNFDWLLPIPNPQAERTTVALEFSATAPLPGRDQRPAGAKLSFLGLEDGSTTTYVNYTAESGPRLAARGLDRDGWMEQHASVLLPNFEHPTEVEFEVEYPPRPGAGPATFRVADATGRVLATPTVSPAQRLRVRVSLPATSAGQTLELTGPDDFVLPAPDGRHRSLRLHSVTFAPKA